MPSTPIQPSTTSASAGSRRVHERNDSPLNHQRRKAETAAARRMTHPKRVGKTTTRLWTRRSFIKSAYPNSSVTACRIRMLCRRLIDPTLSRRRLGDGADQENSIRRIVELRGSELVLPCGLAKARQCNRKYRSRSRCSARQWQEKQALWTKPIEGSLATRRSLFDQAQMWERDENVGGGAVKMMEAFTVDISDGRRPGKGLYGAVVAAVSAPLP